MGHGCKLNMDIIFRLALSQYGEFYHTIIVVNRIPDNDIIMKSIENLNVYLQVCLLCVLSLF